MKLMLLAVGRMKAGPERELLNRYLDRAVASARAVGLGSVQVLEIEESRARSVEQRRRDEAAMFEDRMPAGAAVWLLDERGKPLTSPAFATELGRNRDAALPALILGIGGPDGFDPSFRDKHRTLSFGAATFPHQLVRVLAAEQMYRAITILSGHPYHRD